jgi:hypothetical protein
MCSCSGSLTIFLDFLFRDDKGISEEGLYCAFLCKHSTGEPSPCSAASAAAAFGFVVTSAGCWNYAALVGSTVTLSLALFFTCVVALVVWRRRRASTSSGSRSRLPHISLPSLGRSRPPRFNRLVNEAEFQSVRLCALFAHLAPSHVSSRRLTLTSSARSSALTPAAATARRREVRRTGAERS